MHVCSIQWVPLHVQQLHVAFTPAETMHSCLLTMGFSSSTSSTCQGSRPAGAVLMTWFRAPPANSWGVGGVSGSAGWLGENGGGGSSRGAAQLGPAQGGAAWHGTALRSPAQPSAARRSVLTIQHFVDGVAHHLQHLEVALLQDSTTPASQLVGITTHVWASGRGREALQHLEVALLRKSATRGFPASQHYQSQLVSITSACGFQEGKPSSAWMSPSCFQTTPQQGLRRQHAA